MVHHGLNSSQHLNLMDQPTAPKTPQGILTGAKDTPQTHQLKECGDLLSEEGADLSHHPPYKLLMPLSRTHHCLQWVGYVKLIFERDPCTARCSDNGLASSTRRTLSWSASVVDMKSPNDPVSIKACDGCPLTLTIITTGFGTTHVKSLGTAEFCCTPIL
ncbi:hypothetical protein E4T56_gene10293 [Termitomyces sp. T112]|nr:hypothetical protein E4T56_gene10293 [Termitomyces sp. T112]